MSAASADDVPIETGASVGAGAWVAGVVLTFVVGQLGLSQALSLIIGFAPLRGTLSAYSAFHTWFLSGTGGSMFLVFTLIPIVLLVGAGFFVASNNRASNGFATGASVAVGYLAMTVLSIVLLFVLGSGGVQIVDLLISIVLAGVVFPVVFGGLGGLAADQS